MNSLATRFSISDAGLVNEDALAALDEATLAAHGLLSDFAASQDFMAGIIKSFGRLFDAGVVESLRQQWVEGDLGNLPGIEVRSASELNGANGAFSGDTNTIYLAREFITHNATNPQAITRVLLEEIGHSIDARINSEDTPGDEGEVFAALAQGMSLSESELQILKAENDSVAVTLDRQVIQLEQETDYTGTNLSEIRQGLDSLLSPLQTALDTLVYANNLPLVGDALKDATDSTVDFLTELKNAVNQLGGNDASVAPIQQTLFNGLDGLGWLRDSDDPGTNINPSDIKVSETAGEVRFNFSLGQTPSSISTPIDFDIGLPGLGLEVTEGSRIRADLGFDFDLGFGVNKNTGFFFDTAASNELKLKLDVSTPDLMGKGTLGFLQLEVKDEDADSNPSNDGIDADGDDVNPTQLNGTFGIDLQDADGKLTLADLAGINPTDLINANLSGAANVNLNLDTSFETGVLPSIRSDFNLDWSFDTAADQPDQFATFGNTPKVAFNNVSLNLGSFFSDFARPIVKQIKGVFSPIEPVIDFLNEDLPLIGQSPVELAQQRTVPTNPQVTEGVKIIKALDTLLNIPTNASDINIELGSFDLAGTDVRNLVLGELATVLPNVTEILGTVQEQLKALRDAGFSAEIIDQAEDSLDQLDQLNGGTEAGLFKFPILEDRNVAFGLLLGKPADLFTLDTSNLLKINDKFDRFISVAGPIGLRLAGDYAAAIDLIFGYDTVGLQQFAASGFDQNNAEDLLNGFWVSDRKPPTPTGTDNLEAFAHAGFAAGPAFGVEGLYAFVSGDIKGDANLNLNEPPGPDQDGKLRLATEVSGCLFDTFGKIEAGVSAGIKIGFGFLSYTKRFDLARGTLLSFAAGCTAAEQSDPTRNALATPLGGGVLRLNMGPNFSDRIINGNPASNPPGDIEELFAVRHKAGSAGNETVIVSAFGATLEYANVNRITTDGGEKDDSIVITADVLTPAFLKGGNGFDQLYGGSGNDSLEGGADSDGLYSGNGSDTLRGGAGDDALGGGAGADVLNGEGGLDTVTYEDSPVAVMITPGSGGILQGSGGDAQGDTLSSIEHLVGSQFNDVLFGDGIDNVLEGLAGNDDLRGSNGNDILLGGPGGADFLDGGSGSDWTGYITSFAGVDVNLTTNRAFGGDAQGDTLINIENVKGSVFNDVLTGNAANNYLDSFLGDDRLVGSLGADTLDGGDGTDTLSYAPLPSAINASLKTGVTNKGGSIILASAGISTIENLEGTAFDDALEGDIRANTLTGLAGNDTLRGDEGNDTLVGGPGADSHNGGGSIDLADYSDSSAGVIVNLQPGAVGLGGDATGDTFTQADGKSTVENLLGSDFGDSLTGDRGVNDIDPGLSNSGTDFVDGGFENNPFVVSDDRLLIDYSRNDFGTGITGGFDLNTFASGFLARNKSDGSGILDAVSYIEIERLRLIGTIQNDEIFGGPKDDVLLTGAGNDVIHGGLGSNRIQADDGNDVVIDQGNINRNFDGTPGNSLINLDGGQGIDTLSIDLSGKFENSLFAPINVVLESTNPNQENPNQLFTSPKGTVAISEFEVFKDIETGGGNDTLTQLDRVDNNFSTNAGNDTVNAGLGFDTVNGGDGDDLLKVDYSVGDTGSGISMLLNDDPSSGTATREDLDRIDFSNFERYQVTGTIQDDFIETGSGNDLLYGGASYDFLDGGAGNDLLYGGDDGDKDPFIGFPNGEFAGGLSGGAGDDYLDGGAGEDGLRGGTGNDFLVGSDGDDTLIGTDGDSPNDIDTLTGGAGADKFLLGSSFISGDTELFYDSAGNGDYALITDFNPDEGDIIQLPLCPGGENNTRGYTLGLSAIDLGATAIFERSSNDLIAILQGISSLDLNAPYFSFVGDPCDQGVIVK